MNRKEVASRRVVSERNHYGYMRHGHVVSACNVTFFTVTLCGRTSSPGFQPLPLFLPTYCSASL